MPDLRGPVIGVDGGATKTDAVVLDANGGVLGSGRAGGSNWERLGLERAVGEIALAIDGALGDAGVARDGIAASAFALADVDWPGDPARVDDALESLRLSGRRLVTNDSFAALRRDLRSARRAFVRGRRLPRERRLSITNRHSASSLPTIETNRCRFDET